jgi:hypothetical protein
MALGPNTAAKPNWQILLNKYLTILELGQQTYVISVMDFSKK